jgi:hypothetical protein
MAAKPRPRSRRGLKSSFVVTFSTLATSLAGCGEVHRVETPDTEAGAGASAGLGGTGGGVSGQGGASGASGIGGAGATNPPAPIDPTCPDEEPLNGEACGDRALVCSYGEGVTDNPCDDVMPASASCTNGVWDVTVLFSTCNPPEPPFDGGVTDDDAG